MSSHGIDLSVLESAIDDIEPAGRFAVGGKLANFDLQQIDIEGVGHFPLPLDVTRDVMRLRDRCEQAPYGRGLRTVLDTSVRQAWQMDGQRIGLPGIDGKLNQLTQRAARGLGINVDVVPIKANLYKLVFYEAGGHFLKHRDTEKEPGMFGTLVVQCPVSGGHTGGELIVWHKTEEKRFPFWAGSSRSFYFSAFFADCEHELKTVQSGYRLCLIFNLIRDQTLSSPFLSLSPEGMTELSAALPLAEVALEPWKNPANITSCYPKIAVLLEHQYTEQNLSFSNLKGRDRVVAEVLRSVRGNENKPLLELHLAILTKHESGSAPYSPPRRRHRWDFSDYSEPGHHVMEEVHDTDFKISNWVAVDDTHFSMKETGIDLESELVPPGDPFEDSHPDKEKYEDYTGNAGPTLEYWYRAAVLIIWPRSFNRRILLKPSSMLALTELLERKINEADPEADRLFRKTVARIAQYPFGAFTLRSYHSANANDGILGRLMEMAIRLRSNESAITLLKAAAYENTSAAPGLPVGCTLGIKGFGGSIANAIRSFSWTYVRDDVLAVIKLPVLQSQLACFLELYDAVAGFSMDAAVEIAEAIFEKAQSISQNAASFDWATLVCLLLKVPEGVARRFAGIFKRPSSPAVWNKILSLAREADQNGRLIMRSSLEEPVKICAKLLLGRALTTADAPYVVEMAKNIFWLNDNSLITYLSSQLRRSQHSGDLLRTLLKDVSDLLGSNPGCPEVRATLRTLISTRIQQLQSRRPPTFSWCMPQAQLPRHPQVEAFLRGPEEQFQYVGLNGIGHARNFAQKYFTGRVQDGYSGTAEPGGRGSDAYCTIRKNKAVFQALQKDYNGETEELDRLIALIPTLSGSYNPTERQVLVADGVSASTSSAEDEIELVVLD